MTCKRCKTKPVIKLPNSHISLCKTCFKKYFERKVRKTIRQYKLFKKGQHVGVAVSGGKDSLTTLHVLNNIIKPQRTTKLTAISINEGIKPYRDKTLKHAKKFCKENNIELKIFSFEDAYKKPLDKILKKKKNTIPCSICGVLRRYLLNKKAQELKIDVLATGHNLDDEAQTILMNQFRNNVAASARLGPITGIKSDKKFVRRIKPLYFLTEKEIMTYAILNNITVEDSRCPYSKEAFRDEVRAMVNNLNRKYPSTKSSIVNSFLEVLPLLKKNYKKGKINYCNICEEPCSQEICQTCKLMEEIK